MSEKIQLAQLISFEKNERVKGLSMFIKLITDTAPKMKISRKAKITIGVLLTGLGAIALLSKNANPVIEKATEVTAIPVSSIKALRENLTPEIITFGRVENPNTTTMTASTLSYVEHVHTHEGQYVKKGDVLVSMDTRDAESIVSQAQALLMNNNASLEKLKARQSAERKNYKSQVELLELTKAKETRYEALFKKDQISITTLEELKKQRITQSMAVNNMRLKIEIQAAELASEEMALKSVANQLGQAQLNLDRLSIKAPFEGYITSLNAAKGQRKKAGESILTVYDKDALQIRASVSSDVADRIAIAIKNKIFINGEISVADELIEMELINMSAAVQSGRAGTDLLFSLPPHSRIVLGRALEVKIKLPEKTDVIAIPLQSVYADKHIYTVADGLLKAIDIQRIGTRETLDGTFELLIKSDELENGMPIVISTLNRASSGTKVSIIDRMITVGNPTSDVVEASIN